jgi:methyl-accepting chemotaxis protein
MVKSMNRRNTKIIREGYLRDLILILFFILLACTVISALTLYFDIYKPLSPYYRTILSTITELKESLIIKTLKINVIFYLLISAGTILLIILYTHRIAGPLQRIKTEAKDIAEGNLDKKIILRQDDAINSFAQSLNEMTRSLDKRVSAIKSEIQSLKDSIIEVKLVTEEGLGTEDALKKVFQIDGKIKELLHSIRYKDEGS